jgi:acetamidase/formamidase
MLYTLSARKETVHWGYFSASIPPALKVKSGDFVQIEAVTHHAGDAPELLMDSDIRPHHDRSDLRRGCPAQRRT